MGITLPDGSRLPSNMSQAGLLLPAGKHGPAFLVGKNFDTFYSYNASESYALAIAHLSTLLETNSTNTDFATPWPTDDAGIGRRETKEIQQALINAGYDIGNVDGIIGDGTRKAIMDYQRKIGVPADGRAGQKFYRLIIGNKATNNGANLHLSAAPEMPSTQTTTISTTKTVQPVISITRGSLNQNSPNNSGNQPAVYRRVQNADGSTSLIKK